jgi:hypothetical protein
MKTVLALAVTAIVSWDFGMKTDRGAEGEVLRAAAWKRDGGDGAGRQLVAAARTIERSYGIVTVPSAW